ncbi:MAG TPA: 4Fe-4S dicluster domain-containing protein [Pirellulaceae bacterium]|nr:4Fe-4S dicluster domain-containing protein [Pirellulaceae bacterium]
MESFLAHSDLQRLIDALAGRGYMVMGPTLQQEAIVYDRVTRIEDLPRGWTDDQQPGKYRLRRRDDEEFFGFVVGPHSWKRFLFPPLTTLLTSRQTEEGWEFETPPDDPPPLALLGVRACELAAIAVQDRVFMGGEYVDPTYAERRRKLFLVAVNCTQAASTCFCVSMNTGPRCRQGFDLALTELDDGFLVEIGSDAGKELLAALPSRAATAAELEEAEAHRQRARVQSRSIPSDEVHDLLLANLQHPRWSEVAERCLSCANCTLVCPTCFCSSVQEVSDLTGENFERRRQWDSCFNLDFSYFSGGHVRQQTRARYRQWLTHKLATWIDQFGTSGCVGCGRCITWCPVGIDLTEEVAAMREGAP